MRKTILRWVPPALADQLRVITGSCTVFSHAYGSWSEAAKASAGYDSSLVVERVLDSSRKVRDGQAIYERDSVLFDSIEFSFPVIATLLRAAMEKGGGLSVLDFGGALGSSYRECRPFLGDCVGPLRWSIVEQPAFVHVGEREMQGRELKFYESMGEVAEVGTVDVLLFSGVLQYLPDPYSAIDEAVRLAPRYMVLDRTTVGTRGIDTVHIQTVPRSIYTASYPMWVLSRERILERLKERYMMLSEHPSLAFPELSSIDAKFQGFIFQAN
jgi:putative methyltransferase (TIGR04325 family)